MSWEDKFKTWSTGPGSSEQERCDNAVSMVTQALNEDAELAQFNIEVFPQGSYRARTNIRQDSDVDVCVMLKDTYFVDYPLGIGDPETGNNSSNYRYSDFKNSVERALVRKFGKGQVKRGNKAFDIHENSYRVDADVVPTFEYRQYTPETDMWGKYLYYSGVKLITDKGQSIVNWPEQTYRNGVTKNSATSRTYKRVIRILKRLRNEMQDEGIVNANDIASFLIECLVWNTPNTALLLPTYTQTIREVLAHTFNNTLTDQLPAQWGEVNEIKYLFNANQPWTRSQAHLFLDAAWDYIGYK